MVVILLFCLILTIQSINDKVSEILMAPVENGDINFLRAINSYYGCKTWNGGNCVECSEGYSFNDNKMCRKVPEQCKKFNRGVGICEQCYFGYGMYNGQCTKINLLDTVDRGCKIFQFGLCVQCSERWYFGNKGFCEPVSDDCRKWDTITGACTQCYKGYRLDNGKCQRQKFSLLSTINDFCAQWKDRVCIKCAERAYFGPIGVCIPVSDHCRTWDRYDGFCLSCYKGYSLNNGKCQLKKQQSATLLNNGCHEWDWDNKKCLQCSQRWFMSNGGLCIPIPDDCKSFSNDGRCWECFNGYTLVNGICQLSPGVFEGPSDLGCRIWNWAQKKCLQCSQRWVFNHNKTQCMSVSDYCDTYNQFGKCTRCYRGYKIVQGGCMVDKQPQQPSDPGCKIWNWPQQICLQCSYRWFFDQNGRCQQINDLCNGFSTKTGKCTSCYKGYQLFKGQCIISQKHKDCEVVENQVCIRCYPGFHVQNGECVKGNPFCRTSNSQGQCTSCFQTFALYKNVCMPLKSILQLAEYYASCCPEKLEELKREGRII